MLVLSRKVSQQIVIGNGITVTILRLEGRRVRLGIEAPAEVVIRRAELLGSFEVEDTHPGTPDTPSLPRQPERP